MGIRTYLWIERNLMMREPERCAWPACVAMGVDKDVVKGPDGGPRLVWLCGPHNADLYTTIVRGGIHGSLTPEDAGVT